MTWSTHFIHRTKVSIHGACWGQEVSLTRSILNVKNALWSGNPAQRYWCISIEIKGTYRDIPEQKEFGGWRTSWRHKWVMLTAAFPLFQMLTIPPEWKGCDTKRLASQEISGCSGTFGVGFLHGNSIQSHSLGWTDKAAFFAIWENKCFLSLCFLEFAWTRAGREEEISLWNHLGFFCVVFFW